MTSLRIALLALAPCAIYAQNTDLGLLLGVSGPSTSTNNGVVTSTAVSAHFQVNVALQMKETTAGRLYLEFPFLIGGHVRSTVGKGVYASEGATLYLTPGVRWNFFPHSRVSVYGAVGGGLAGFAGDRASVTTEGVNALTGFAATLGGEFGGGLDLRLSRLVSLRFETRDFITEKGFEGVAGHHHLIFGFGMGFHW